MSRRAPYTKVEKHGHLRADRVKGKGDVAFKLFQCLNTECEEFICLEAAGLGDDNEFDFNCPTCGFRFKSGFEHKLYDYDVVMLDDASIYSQGEFAIGHREYVGEAPCYKYCILCCAMKPVEAFDRHAARASGRQGECRLCKQRYNELKNETRLTDQHREAAQKRRLLLTLSGQTRVDSAAIHARFGGRCFKCGKDLQGDMPATERPLDHTLPVKYLWPLNTETATLLCRVHNAEKAEKWPSEYYSDDEVRRLVALTGLSYQLLSGSRVINPEAVERIKTPGYVDRLIPKYAAYMPEICKLRNKILLGAGIDLFEFGNVAKRWTDEANAMLGVEDDEE